MWAAADTSHLELPVELTIDEAGLAEGPILVNLHLEGGEELPFQVDTASGRTYLDETLAPKLGRRAGSRRARFSFDNRQKTEQIYPAPRLFAGNIRLLMGPRVSTLPMANRSPPQKGILGMDCLQYYCVQVDCTARKLRFLDPDDLDTQGLGPSFPITFETSGISAFDADLFGRGKMRFVLDTGCSGPFDGMLSTKLFEWLVREHPPIGPDLVMTVADGRSASGNAFSRLEMCGQPYTDLKFFMGDFPARRLRGLIGMRFLARHLATFNFPKQTLYLKRISSAPLTE